MTIRTRLTVWYGIVLAASLCGLGIAHYALVSRESLERLDETLRATAHSVAGAWLAGLISGAGEVDPWGLLESSTRLESGGLEIVILDQANSLLARRPREGLGLLDRSTPFELEGLLRGMDQRGVVATVSGNDASRRAFAMQLAAGGRRQSILVAQSLDQRDAMLASMRALGVFIVIGALCLGLGGGYLLADRALAPLRTLAASAELIEASTLSQRLGTDGRRDEIGLLSRAFNRLLSRLDKSFDLQRQFMADASHELRTPVAIVRGEADVVLARDDLTADEYRGSAEVIRDEARHMSRLIDDLLLLARSDAGADILSPSEIYLDEIVEEVVRGMRVLAKARDVTIELDSPGELPMTADEQLIRRLVVSLVDNAITHGGSGGKVTICADRHGNGSYVLTVMDRGPGIPAELRDRVFDRFVHGQDIPLHGGRRGSGLGLAIAKRIAQAHGGTISLAHAEPRRTEFRVVLPAGISREARGW